MDVGDVDHASVHADVADNRAALSIDQDLPASVAEVAIQSVGGVILANEAGEFCGVSYVADISSGDLYPEFPEA